jgi:hypothetical protein
MVAKADGGGGVHTCAPYLCRFWVDLVGYYAKRQCSGLRWSEPMVEAHGVHTCAPYLCRFWVDLIGSDVKRWCSRWSEVMVEAVCVHVRPTYVGSGSGFLSPAPAWRRWLIYEYHGVHAPEVATGHLSVFETLLELRSLTYLVALERIAALSI